MMMEWVTFFDVIPVDEGLRDPFLDLGDLAPSLKSVLAVFIILSGDRRFVTFLQWHSLT